MGERGETLSWGIAIVGYNDSVMMASAMVVCKVLLQWAQNA